MKSVFGDKLDITICVVVFLQKLHDDIVLHTKDVGKFKEHGKDLAELQDTIKDDVLSTIRKYKPPINSVFSVLFLPHFISYLV